MFAEKKYTEITKDNFEPILRSFAKHFKKLNGKSMPAELILVGGAAVMARYGFRDMTKDFDSIIRTSSAVREAASIVEDEFGLEHNWLNNDFQRTDSYSKELILHSKHYRTYYGILDVRTIDAEYLIAMKMVSAREHSNDLPDIVGIVAEQIEMENPITFEKVDTAMNNLYGGWDKVSDQMKQFLHFVLEHENPNELYDQMKAARQGIMQSELSPQVEKAVFYQKKGKELDIEDDLEI